MSGLAYYPGCSLRHSAAEFDVSTRVVLDALSIEYTEVPDWTCCGSSPAHMTDHLLAQSLAARNLRQAAMVGDRLFAPCPSCHQREKNAALEIHDDQVFRAEVNELLDVPYEADVSVLTLPEVLVQGAGPDRIKDLVKADLCRLRVVPYYGCLLGRPKVFSGESNDEQPVIMDVLLEAAGADVRPWNYKTECCGASIGIPKADIQRRLSRKVLEQALEAGAEAVVVCCPLCHQNLDMRQTQINVAFGTDLSVPVLYLTQVIGLAMGYSPEQMMLQKHFVDPRPLVARAIEDAVAFRAEEARVAAEKEARRKVVEAARAAKVARRAAKKEDSEAAE
jgi:heterodisulfide reductase subunit B